MSKLTFLIDLGVTRAEFLTILLLVLNAFTWYLVAFEVLDSMLNVTIGTSSEIIMVWSIHYVAMASATLIGPVLLKRIARRRNILLLWMALGVICSLVPMLFVTVSLISASIFSLLLGLTFGFGMPACMGYLADYTSTERRGRFGGLIYFAIGVGTFLLLTTLIPFTRLTDELAILAGWRGFGLISFLVLSKKDDNRKAVTRSSYASIFRKRPLALYLIPWVMFCLVDSLARSLFPPEVVRTSFIVGSVITGLSSLASGFFSDLVGRKRVVIAGFVMLGIGYAILGTFPELPISQLVFTVLGSIAGGTFGAVFLMILWGDLAEGTEAEKYYAIGGLPYLLSGYFGLLAAPYLRGLISPYATFSFASFFLFIAVFPLWLATETLPEKEVQKRLLEGYVKDAEKVKKKLGKRDDTSR